MIPLVIELIYYPIEQFRLFWFELWKAFYPETQFSKFTLKYVKVLIC